MNKRFLVRGHWTAWSEWSECQSFPINPGVKISERKRECDCDHCTIYCRIVFRSLLVVNRTPSKCVSINGPKAVFKTPQSGTKTVERKLCHRADSCGADGFCITATSSNQQWPCSLWPDGIKGTSIYIHRNGNLIAWDQNYREHHIRLVTK